MAFDKATICLLLIVIVIAAVAFPILYADNVKYKTAMQYLSEGQFKQAYLTCDEIPLWDAERCYLSFLGRAKYDIKVKYAASEPHDPIERVREEWLIFALTQRVCAGVRSTNAIEFCERERRNVMDNLGLYAFGSVKKYDQGGTLISQELNLSRSSFPAYAEAVSFLFVFPEIKQQ